MAEEYQIEEHKKVGSIKFEGKIVEPGILDAGKAASALAGLNEILRYFNSCQSTELATAEYEIPVQVRPGSWEAVVIAGASVFAAAYLARAGNEMAKRDFEGLGFKDIFKKSMQALVYLVRLAKHTSKLKNWNLEKPKWRNENKEIGILNENGEYTFIPEEFLDWYYRTPTTTIAQIVAVVEIDRELVIDATHEHTTISEKITIQEKNIFIPDEKESSDEESLFPELKHGNEIELEGIFTRGNKETNFLGLNYNGHILNCIPDTGSIVRYKHALFLRCQVKGRIARLNKQGVAEKKPTIIVHSVTPLEHDVQGNLF